ncbi:hypothetical protein [Kineosporia babensis]|uniref:Uncharacterized protein n=1 Tax=Kineosporia babensis TaxID=499548 RepID=A0A9X1NAU6_9ACTN|nr:hypothetical protein [Kineosporia babensis]MCD5310454.1 hypothetical protein [Kineosporia babensis]
MNRFNEPADRRRAPARPTRHARVPHRPNGHSRSAPLGFARSLFDTPVTVFPNERLVMRVFRAIATAALAAGLTTGSLVATTESAQAAPSPRTACSGLADCRIVKQIDVDGDGAKDEVGVRQSSRTSLQFRVLTARKRLLVKRMRIERGVGQGAYFGAARIDGVRGAELVYAYAVGANTVWYKTLTYRQGRLVLVKSPLSEVYFPGQWPLGSSYGLFSGVTRKVKNGNVSVTFHDGVRDHAGDRGWDIVSTTYVWRKKTGGWEQQSVRSLHTRSEKKVSAHYQGWHVPGLPKG